MNEQYSPTGFKVLPTIVKHLLIINVLMYFAYYVLLKQGIINLNYYLGIWSLSTGLFRIWQPLTYMFMHGSFDHLFFNMFSLWMFGSALENFWGSKRFLFYYLVCGIGAGLLNMLVPGAHVSVGASGAVYALLLAFGMMWPNNYIYLYFLVPIRTKWFIIGMIVIELFEGIFRSTDGIAHFAHLGGMLIGFLIILYWKRHGGMTGDFSIKNWFNSLKNRKKYTRYEEVYDKVPRSDEEYNYQKAQKERDIDAILDKVAKSGYESLSKEEKDFLFKNSK
jgi:membrane associated rhomboid family serine protease